MAGNWTKQQLEAIETDNCNILVSAAAGSGKTAVLVERIIRKITDKDHPTDIDRMIVVTFTKAAAAEMKQRIRNALDDMIQKDPNNELLQRQLTLTNNAHITTIDSFCLNVVRNHFADIDIDPAFRTADENEIMLLENDIMEEMLEQYYSEGDGQFLDLVDSYGTGRDDLRLVDIVTKIYKYARSNPWEAEWYDECLAGYHIESVEELDNNPAVRFLWEDIKAKLRDYKRLYEKLIGVCESPGGPIMYLAAVRSDMAAMNMLLEADSFARFAKLVELMSFDTLGRGGKKEVDEDKKTYVKAVRDDYKDYINKTVKKKYLFQSLEKSLEDIKKNVSAISMMIKLARDFSERMSEEKRNRNIIDFNDMEHMALDILIKREDGKSIYTEVADALSEYYDEVMVDEYQDSNMLQEVILTAISKGRGDSGLTRNNMYMVGDVKQSIYKFRLACPELFIEKYDRFEKHFREGTTANYLIELQNNFRSRKSVLDACNDVFLRLMNKEYCHIEYNDDTKLNAGLDYSGCQGSVVRNGEVTKAVDFGEDSSVDIHLVPTEDEDADKKELEAAAIADIIEEMFTGDVRMIYDRNVEGGYRPIKYSDIVVLGRAVKSGWADGIVNTLLSRGIPAYSDASDGYFSVREIQVVLSLLKIIDNPLQDIPMASVMLSYFGRFDAQEMAMIRKGNKADNLYTQLKNVTDGKLQGKVDTFLKMLDRYREKSELVSVRDLIWAVIYETGYYDYVGTMPAAQRRQANLDILLERAAAYESTSYSGLFNFLRYVERMQKFETNIGEASVLGEQDNLVRIMTIHKSKGLEFPVVILAGMGKKINKNDAKGDVLLDQKLGIGTNVVYLDERIKRSTLAKAAIANKLVSDSVSEEMRVLYVAMTRAREKLIVTGTVKNCEESVEKWTGKAEELKEAGTFSYTDISKFNLYFDMFMPVACMGNECNQGEFKIVYHSAGTEDDMESDERVDDSVMMLGKTVAVENNLEIPKYPYDIDIAKKAKVTVSELKMMQHDVDFSPKSMVADGVTISENEIEREAQSEGESEKADSDESNVQQIIPKFIKGAEEKLEGNERGTAYHRIMECLDYGRSDYNELGGIKTQIADMLAQEKIDKAQLEAVEPKDIEKFCASDIGKRVKCAADNNKLWREQPFVFIEEKRDEAQLIQGVIDLYLVEEDGITIVDYKTDRVKRGKAGEEELRKRYAVQLDYYGKALSQLTGLPVKEKVIYSFTLSKQIEV